MGGCSSVTGSEETMDTHNVTFGVFTDIHYADKESSGTRFYRDSIGKLNKCIDTFNELKPDFIIGLGDFIDSGGAASVISYLQTVVTEVSRFQGARYYVLGNHDLSDLTKEDCAQVTGQKNSFFSFDCGSWHFIILDANFNGKGEAYCKGNFEWTDSWIPAEELSWLKSDLFNSAGKSAIVFIHQNLQDESSPYGVKNAVDIRALMESAGTVKAVFQGHNHAGGFASIGGIPYITFRGMVEGHGLSLNSFALTTLSPHSIKVTGYGIQENYSIDIKQKE